MSIKLMSNLRFFFVLFFKFAVIFEKAQKICEELDVEFNRPRLVTRQAYRSNQPSENVEEFFRISIFIPYLESVISSLRNRFSSTHKKAFSLMQFHPGKYKKIRQIFIFSHGI